MRGILFVSLLAGCGSDFGLGSVAGSDIIEEIGGSHTGPATTHRDPITDPHGGGGLWGHLDPGNLPDIYFAVAYSPTPDWYCDACDAEAWYGYGDGEVHYAVIDLHGQVVWDVPLPYGTTGFSALDLAAAGPGQFTAVIQPWQWDTAAEADGFYGASNWEAWRMDAVALTVERTAWERLDAPVTHIEHTGVDVDLGASAWLHTGAWVDDPDRALFLPSAYACGVEGVGDLRSVPLADAAASVVSWPAASLLPTDLAGPAWAWGMEPGIDGQGDPTVLVGLSAGDCYNAGASIPRAVVWSPTDGVRWSADLGADTWPLAASYDPRQGGGVLSFGFDDAGAQEWRVSEPDDVREGPLGTDLYNWRPGPLLEHGNDAFIAIGTRPVDAFDTIEIRYRGERVWHIDDLRVGMGHIPVRILDFVVIPPA